LDNSLFPTEKGVIKWTKAGKPARQGRESRNLGYREG